MHEKNRGLTKAVPDLCDGIGETVRICGQGWLKSFFNAKRSSTEALRPPFLEKSDGKESSANRLGQAYCLVSLLFIITALWAPSLVLPFVYRSPPWGGSLAKPLS